MTLTQILVAAALAAIAALCALAARTRGYRPNVAQYAGLVGLCFASVSLGGRVLDMSRIPPDCALAAFSVLLLAIGTGAKVLRYRRPQWCDTQPADGWRATQHGRAHPLLLGLLALVLAACTSLQAPRNLTDSLAYTQTSITAARDTAAALLQRDRISVATARTVQARADDAQQALRTARLLAQSGDQAGARDRLAAATAILLEIEASLKGAQP